MADTLRRRRALKAAQRVERDLYGLENATLRTLIADLEAARLACLDVLARSPKDWQISHAQSVLGEIERQLRVWADEAIRAVGGSYERGADLGRAMTIDALGAGGVELTSHPMIPTSVVATAYQTLPHLIRDVSADTVAKVGRILRQSVLAQQTPLDAMRQVGRIAGPAAHGPFRNAALRGEFIVRTELGRIAQSASWATQQDLARYPANAGMMSEWVATHDARTRPSHLAADGQQVTVGNDFTVGAYRARYPHDPRLPAGESVGCRCIVVPWHPEFD